jgi:MGT family glycosyltransferase
MRILMTMWDGAGNVTPSLGLARRLIKRGHIVRVLGDPTIEREALDAGCGFSPWTTAPHRKSRSREDDLIPDYKLGPMKMIDVYMREFLGNPAPRWASDIGGELDRYPADFMLADFAIPASLIVAEARGLPNAVLMTNIWILPTPGIPPLGPGLMPARGPLGRLRDSVLRTMHRRLFDRALPHLNAVRRELGLGPVHSTQEQMLRTDRVLVQTSPAFDFTSPAMPANLRWVGPQLDDPAWTERFELPWSASDVRPLVVVGMSSMYQNQAAALRNVVEALRHLPVRGLVTRGQAITATEVAGGDNVVVVDSLPHSQVLPHASALVTHCGHGTTMKGLAAGVPLVCMPMGRDQNDTAVRVVCGGAGIRLSPKANPRAIRTAIERVLGEPRFRENARKLAQAIVSGQGCVDPVAEIEGLVSHYEIAGNIA